MSSDLSRLVHQSSSQWIRCRISNRHAVKVAPSAQMMPFRGLVSRQGSAQQSNESIHKASSKVFDGRQLRDLQASPGVASAAVDIPEPTAESATAPGSAAFPSNLASIKAEALQPGSTKFVAETRLPTRTGAYRVRAYRHTVAGKVTEPMCIMTGQPEGCRDVVVRVHDACFTSEVLGSLKCDCAEQLQLAMRYIQDCPPGIVVYLQQEGRGIGLANKIAAYALQEEGYDTVDANRQLGFDDDCREYSSVRNILQDLGITSIKLMTNNPRKINTLESLGVTITERIPCIVEAQEFSQGYLNTKVARMSHVLDGPKLDGSYCYWNHSGDPLVQVNGSIASLNPSALDQSSNEESASNESSSPDSCSDSDVSAMSASADVDRSGNGTSAPPQLPPTA